MGTRGGEEETGRGPGQRYTVQEAAEILGTTVDGIRSRIKRGTLQSTKVGGTVFVLIEHDQSGLGAPSLVGESKASPDTSAEALIEAKDEAIAELREQVAYLRQKLDEAHQANAEHRRLLAAALERVPPAIEAPPEPREAAVSAGESREGDRDAQDTESRQTAVQSRSWWKRWFGR